MGRIKGKLMIDPNDIVGKTYGRYEINKYLGLTYSKGTKRPEKLRHWYSVFAIKNNSIKVVERRHIIGFPKYR